METARRWRNIPNPEPLSVVKNPQQFEQRVTPISDPTSKHAPVCAARSLRVRWSSESRRRFRVSRRIGATAIIVPPRARPSPVPAGLPPNPSARSASIVGRSIGQTRSQYRRTRSPRRRSVRSSATVATAATYPHAEPDPGVDRNRNRVRPVTRMLGDGELLAANASCVESQFGVVCQAGIGCASVQRRWILRVGSCEQTAAAADREKRRADGNERHE